MQQRQRRRQRQRQRQQAKKQAKKQRVFSVTTKSGPTSFRPFRPYVYSDPTFLPSGNLKPAAKSGRSVANRKFRQGPCRIDIPSGARGRKLHTDSQNSFRSSRTSRQSRFKFGQGSQGLRIGRGLYPKKKIPTLRKDTVLLCPPTYSQEQNLHKPE